MNSELHLIIIWHTAKSQYESIIQTLNSKFKILGVYEVFWDKECFVDNLIKFYSHSQFHLNPRKMKRMFRGKAKYCGIGSFYLIVFNDNMPEYAERSTSSGNREVNINIFDLKQRLRILTGGGHKIHATDSEAETNKDLTLLLGMNTTDYLRSHVSDWNNEISVIYRNITGSGGYDSLESFLYVLNSSLEYVVLRNFEQYPERYSSNEHGDIDLLVTNIKLLKHLSGAEKIYKRKHRVHYKVRISDKDVYFDFRHIGDDYYDKQWEMQILKTRILKDNLFYVPDEINYYYSLLYHAILHKPFLTHEYEGRLLKGLNQNIAQDHYSPDSSKHLFQKLVLFMSDNNYKYVVPRDISVYFNSKYLKELGGIRVGMTRRIRQLVIDRRLYLAKVIRGE